jgi:uncharacterized protein YjdB
LVTAVAAGTATITVTTQDGAKTATSAITVTAANVAVTGVTVSPTSASIAAGATQQLTATIAPSNATNKNITWSSSNTAVATVNTSGLVSGVSGGSAVITVTTQDGAKTATSTITVTSGTSLPAPWVTADIGSVGVAGTASYAAPTFSAQGSGADIWDTADAFRYIYQTVTGDVTITARIATLGNSDPWAKAGVMVRESNAAGSTHALSAVTVSNGTAFQNRLTTGAASNHTAGPAGAAPYWVRLTRVGNVFTSFVSTNGTTWTQVGAATTITMVSQVLVGLAVTSHNNAVLNPATFDNVTVTTGNVAVTGVTVSPTSASIIAGATQQLTATVAPANATNKNVTWSSSNTAVATVSTTGLVTAVAAGSATISVTTQDGSKTATSSITVTTANVAVTGVTVSPTSASITAGGTQQLTATVAPANATNKNVAWTSSNTAVATVNTTGLVTAVAAGSTTITVTTQDGSKTATSAITVTAANVAVTGVAVSPTSASIAVGATQQLTATVAPSNATNKNVTWTTSSASIATVSSSGLVTAVAAGSATITVTTQDGSKTAICAITVTSAGTNLALNKTTTTSSTETGTSLGSLAVDGNATTRWSSAFADPQWIYVDLGASYNVNRVKITWEAAYASAYTVQTSPDAATWTTIKTVTGNATTTNDWTGLTGTGRYVRVYGTARATVYGYSIFELEVYGTPASTACIHTSQFGDYTVEISNASPNPTLKFIPSITGNGSPTCILYYGTTATGNYPGFAVTPNTAFQITAAAGTKVYFYYTYSLASGGEQNTSGSRDSYTVGGTCTGGRLALGEEEVSERDYVVYPNPVLNTLTISGSSGSKIGIINAQGIEVSNGVMETDDRDVSELSSGVYMVMLSKNNKMVVKRFVKK